MKNKIINRVITMMCAVSISLGGAAVSVNAGGPGLVNENQSIKSQEEAQKRFQELFSRIHEKKMTFFDWNEKLDVDSDMSDYYSVMNASNALDDAVKKIEDGWDKNKLDEQIKLIDEYEELSNKCAKIMEDYKTKYEKLIKEKADNNANNNIDESQMSIININKEITTAESDEKAKDERLLSRKDELQELYNRFSNAYKNWKDFTKRVQMADSVYKVEQDEKKTLMVLGHVEDDFLTIGFEQCKSTFSKVVGYFGKITDDTLLESELEEKDIDALFQSANNVIRNSEDYMKQYDKSYLDGFAIY